MAAIDIGNAATDRTTAAGAPYTYIDLANPANNTGWLTSFEVWFNTNAAGVKVGTFSGSGTDYTSRDVETIGNVTAGSKQTFSGLNCDVTTGDFIGYYAASGNAEADTGSTNLYEKAGDQFGAGTQTYTLNFEWGVSVYGIGTGDVIITPITLALVLATYAPVLQLSVIPSTLALTLTTYAPVLKLSVTPSTLALTLTTYAPVLPLSVIPSTLALTLTTYAPDLFYTYPWTTILTGPMASRPRRTPR